MRRALALLPLCGCFLHASGGPAGVFVYGRGRLEGSGGLFVRRVGGPEHRLVAGDDEAILQPAYADARGRVVFTRMDDPSRPDGYYAIDRSAGEERFLTPFAGGGVELIGERLVFQAGGEPSRHPALRSVAIDGTGRVELARKAWMCGATADGRVAYVDLAAEQLVVADPDGTRRQVIGDDVGDAAPPARANDAPDRCVLPDGRLVFYGRPPGGGALGEYVATVAGATTLITTDTAGVYGALPDGRFVVETFVRDERWSRGDQIVWRRDRIELLAPGAAPSVSLPMESDASSDLTGDYDQITAITPSGRVIVGRYVTDTNLPAQDYFAIGDDGVPVAIATDAQFFGVTPDGRVVYQQVASFRRTDLPARGTWSVPETGGAPTLLSVGRAVAIAGGWVVYAIDDEPRGWTLGAIAPDGSRRHVLASGHGDFAFDDDVIDDAWIVYRKGETLRLARLDGGEDRFIAGGDVYQARFFPDVTAPPRRSPPPSPPPPAAP